jgi:hypothetical protein
VALIGALIGPRAGRIPVARLELVEQFLHGDKVLSKLPADAIRRIRAEQSVVAELEPERGLQSLPKLLADPADRRRVLAVLDKAVAAVRPTEEQHAMIDRVRDVLAAEAARPQPEEVNGIHRQPAGAT